jgi:hypothetical protein
LNKFGSILARVISILLCIAFVLSSILSVFMTATERRLMNASIYKNALVQQQIYDRLPGAIAQQLAAAIKTQPTSSGIPSFLQNLSAANWELIVTGLAPPDLLRSETEGLIDQLFAYWNGEQDSVSLDLTPLKDRLVGSAGQEALLNLIRAQPACTLQQIAQSLVNALGGGGFGICRPPDSLLAQATPLLQALLGQLNSQLPNTVTLIPASATQASAAGGTPAQSPAVTFRNARLIMRLSPDLPLVFLLFICLLAIRNPKDWLRWWGVPLCAAGLIGAIVVLVLSASFEGIWNNSLAAILPSGLTPALVALVHDLLRSVILAWLGGVLISCILYSLVGLGMSIGSIFIHSEARRDLPPSSPSPGA